MIAGRRWILPFQMARAASYSASPGTMMSPRSAARSCSATAEVVDITFPFAVATSVDAQTHDRKWYFLRAQRLSTRTDELPTMSGSVPATDPRMKGETP